MPSLVASRWPIFPSTVSGKGIPIFTSTGNANMPVQSALWNSRVFLAVAGGGNGFQSAFGSIGGLSVNGTGSTPALATTNLYTIQQRVARANVITTANQQVGAVGSAPATFLRGASAGQGGFFFVCRFGLETWTAGDRLFVGLAAAGPIVAGQPSAITDMVGFGIDASDTAITFMHNDSSGTAVKTSISGTTLASGQGYIAYIFCKPNDTVVYYRLDDINAGTMLVDSSIGTSELPTNTTFLLPFAVMGNAANTGAGNATIGLLTLYIETDR